MVALKHWRSLAVLPFCLFLSGCDLAVPLLLLGVSTTYMGVNTRPLPIELTLDITARSEGGWTLDSHEFDYLTNSFPIQATIQINLSAEDTIHTLSIPELGVRLDAVPGRINSSWVSVSKPITVTAQCAQHPKENTGVVLTFN